MEDARTDRVPSLVSKRILNELKDLMNNPPVACRAGYVKGDILHCQALLQGPEDSPYAGGLFCIDIRYPQWYPFRPPKVRLKTRVFHPNINSNGEISLEIFLKEQWTPTMTITQVILSIFSILVDPDFNKPLVPKIVDIYKEDRAKYEKYVRMWTKKYAMHYEYLDY